MRICTILHLRLSSYLDGQSSPIFFYESELYNFVSVLNIKSNVWFSYDCIPLRPSAKLDRYGCL